MWYLDFRRTGPRDEGGFDFDLAYQHPVHATLYAQTGLEIGTVRHGLPSIQVVRDEPDAPFYPVWGQNRHDSFRRARVGLLWRWQGLIRIEYGLRSQGSNSVDAALSRHELTWLWSRGLPFGLTGQFFGSLEHTRYSDPHLGSILVVRSGDPEAGDDDNAVVLRLGRSFGRGWTVEARHAWYRNESLLVENYYRKRIWSVGLSWESGQLSGF
jgi:hypothetical protein